MGVIFLLVLLTLGVVSGKIDQVKISENALFKLLDLELGEVRIDRVAVSEKGLFKVPQLKDIYRNYRAVEGVSEKCAKQLDVVTANTDLLMTVLDASSKFPYPGLGISSKLQYGNFDQCMTIDYKYDGGRILGEHCTVGLVIPDITMNTSDPNTYFRLSVCRPDDCDSKDLNAVASNLTSGVFPALFQDLLCQTKESYSTYTAADIVTLTIFGIFILLMVLSTAFDVFIYHSHSKNVHPLLASFSVLSNGRKLFHISSHSKSKEQIETFHGLRVISMMWIVAGHGFVSWQSVSVTNKPTVDTWLKQRYAGYIATGPLAVDTFFFMSGFLLAFQYLKSKPKPLGQQAMSVPSMYLHRYLRLTPAMLMIFLVTLSLFKHMGNGPLWSFSENLGQSCKNHWWSFFLYIQNYYNYDDLCLTQTWYLSADMQMFLLAPLVLIPLSLTVKRPSGFAKVMVVLLVLNIIFTFLPMGLKFAFRDYKNNYDTHSRLINYFIGVMLGVFMREKIDKPFMYIVNEGQKFIINLGIWSLIILVMLATVICYQEVEMNHGYDAKSVFYSLMRPVWCIGLSWITYSCYHGYGGIVNWILCRPIYQVLGRLTYCIYLVHGSVIMFYTISTKVSWYFTDYNAFYQFCGHYLLSIIVAMFWTLAFESPLIIVEKFLMGGFRRPAEVKPTAPPLENVERESKTNFGYNGSSTEMQEKNADAEAYRRNNEIY